MGYLRGSIPQSFSSRQKRATYVKPTIQNQINQLSRRVGQNQPAKNYFRTSYTDTAILTGVGSTDSSLTNDFIAGTNFRNYVNGDTWSNVGLRIRGVIENAADTFRVIVYVPKKTGNGLTASAVKSDMARILDPAAFWVLTDFYVERQSVARGTYDKYISLKNLQTIYNTDSTVLERGDIRIYIAWDASSTGLVHHTSAQLCVRDK